MSLTCGFFNSLNGDRKYDANQFTSIFDGLIKDGVFSSIGDAMVVTANGGLTVSVGTGRAWFNRTWTFNDTELPLVATPSDILLDRIDAVVLEVNHNENVRTNTIKIIEGTPASKPANPTMINDELVHQYPLCYISRPAKSTVIEKTDITNTIGTAECPFVTGILTVVTLDNFIQQWKAQFTKWLDTAKTDYTEWYATMVASLEANSAALETWMTEQQNEFTVWFSNIQAQLAGDVAGNILSQIDNHKSDTSNPHEVSYEQVAAKSGVTTTKDELNRLSGVTGNVQNQLDGKAPSSHGAHVSFAATNPVMDGSATPGSASTVARSDHKHPTDTSRAPAYSYGTSDLTAGSSPLETGKLYFVYE